MKNQLNQTALISVDNIKTFEDVNLHELYVPEGEQAAIKTKEARDMCTAYGTLLVNVFEKHPKGHISFASSYRDKQPFDIMTLEEIKDWTQQRHGLSSQAKFTVDQLKNYLSRSPGQTNQVWPDHAKDWTESMELMPPLSKEDFDLHLIKGEKIDEHPYSAFPGTGLHEELQKRNIKTIFVTWVATDYCSGQTAEDGINLGYETYMITDAIRGVVKEKTEEMLSLLTSKGVKFITIQELEYVLKKSK